MNKLLKRELRLNKKQAPNFYKVFHKQPQKTILLISLKLKTIPKRLK